MHTIAIIKRVSAFVIGYLTIASKFHWKVNSTSSSEQRFMCSIIYSFLSVSSTISHRDLATPLASLIPHVTRVFQFQASISFFFSLWGGKD